VGETVEISLTQEAIAELAGAKRPTVNRVLREESERGLIELMRGRIRILDIDALRKRAR
jgi:CRP-like cAMP-binding protein